MSLLRSKFRKALIISLALVIVLAGISAINKKLHISPELEKLTGQVEGIFIANKFLDSIPAVIPASAALTSPYQDVQGDVAISGNLGIGTNTPVEKVQIYAAETGTSGTNTAQAASIDYDIKPTGNSTLDTRAFLSGAYSRNTNPYNIGKLTGLGADAEHEGTGTFTEIIGSYGWALNKAGSAGTKIYGVGAWAQSDTGTVTDVRGLDAWAGAYGGTVTNMYGVMSWLSKGASATVTNRFGLYLGASGAATNDYAIYQATSSQKNYFAGNIYIETPYPQLKLRHPSAPGAWWNLGPDNSANNMVVYNQNSKGVYLLNDSINGWSNQSDQRLKTNIKTLTPGEGLEAIKKLNPVRFNWIDTRTPDSQIGFIAQEVQKIFPEFVSIAPDSTMKLPNGTMQTIEKPLGISVEGFIAPIVKAIQELAQNLFALTQRVDTQEQKIQALQQEVNQLKQEILLLKQSNR